MYRTNNAAIKWELVNCCYFISDLSISPQSGDVYIASDDRVFRSRDAGRTFTRLPTKHPEEAKVSGIAAHPLVPGFVIASTQVHGIQLSTDSGNTWRVSNRGMTNAGAQSFAISPNGKVFLVTGSYSVAGYPFLSRDAGRTWSFIPSIGHDFKTAIIHPRKPKQMLLQGDKIYWSENAGVTWKKVWDNYLLVPSFIAIAPGDPNIMYAGVDDYLNEYTPEPRGIMSSRDGGKTWGCCDDTILSARSIAVNPFTSRDALAATRDSIFRTIDTGATWKKVHDDRSVRWVGYDPADRNMAYAVSDSLLVSTDAGSSWKSKPFAGIDGNVNRIVIDPYRPSTFYAEVEGLLYVSSDRGGAWSLFDLRGLPGGASLQTSPVSPDVLYAATSLGVCEYDQKTVAGGPAILQWLPNPIAAGTSLEIRGRNFGTATGIVQLGTRSLSPTSWSPDRISVTLPSEAQTAQLLVVAGGKSSNRPEVIVVPPSSRSLHPDSGPAAGGTRVILRITDLTKYLELQPLLFGKSIAGNLLRLTLDPDFNSDNWLLCTSPPGSGKVPIHNGETIFGEFQYNP